MTQPDISIICTNLNHIDYIDECVHSVFSQIGDVRFEFIVADGGSTDGSLEYLRKHSAIKLIEGPDSGPVEAYTKALNAASGRYIMMTTSTDGYLSRHWFRTIVDILDKDDRIGMVVGHAARMTETGTLLQCNPIPPARDPEQWFLHWMRSGAHTDTWLNELSYCVRAPIFRCCWIESNDFPDADLIDDRVIRMNFEFNRLGYIHLQLPFIANFTRSHGTAERPQLVFQAGHWKDSDTYMKLTRQYRDDLLQGRRNHYIRNGNNEIVAELDSRKIVPVVSPFTFKQ